MLPEMIEYVIYDRTVYKASPRNNHTMRISDELTIMRKGLGEMTTNLGYEAPGTHQYMQDVVWEQFSIDLIEFTYDKLLL